jgi:dihydroxyacetone kinase
MTHVLVDPRSFAADALAGLCDLHPDLIRAVPGGVVRATHTATGKVAVVVGGGSGHYPAFAGYVGRGLADAAVVGDVFASPSARQVHDVARAADRGAGVLLAFGNYAGDALNFGLAAERLRAEGVPTEVIAVTDDIASATADRVHERRGVAGDVIVFKTAGAAAEAGYDLDGVARVARSTNAQTRSLGVAFSGCTLPGAPEPLFTVPADVMGVGLGVHGEAGIAERPIATAHELSALLVDGILADAPDAAGERVAVILNGLGATKYEELFVLWHHVGRRLREAGLELVAPAAGELVTSLDMAGCSLTVSWLDEETTGLWCAPAYTAAFRLGAPEPAAPAAAAPISSAAARRWPPASEESATAAAEIVRILGRIASALGEAEAELGRIDARAGDGDHGRGMALGSHSAHAAGAAALEAGAGASSVLAAAADAWADRCGGTSGALWGVALRAWSEAFSDTSGVSPADVGRGARHALDAVVRLGGAQVGDKTLVDAAYPFVETLNALLETGVPLAAAWRAAAREATSAAEATAALEPRLGRARPLAQRSLGHPDAGAVSLALCARTVAEALELEGTRND